MSINQLVDNQRLFYERVGVEHFCPPTAVTHQSTAVHHPLPFNANLFRLRPVAALWRGRGLPRASWLGYALAALSCTTVWAEADTGAELRLRMSPALQERLPQESVDAAPSFLSGERIQGKTDAETVIEGGAEWRRHDIILRAERLTHDERTGVATATGNVRINRMGDIFEGPHLTLQLDTFQGSFDQPRYRFMQTGGHGQAQRLDFIDKQHAVAHDATYTTCERPPLDNWAPAWLVTASRIEFDRQEDTGTATNSVLSFKGVPILAAPWVSFPLSEKRKSGVLPPTINLDNQSGFETTLPYYLNLAPNRDATLYPTLMTKRGVDLGGELRYLERDWAGTLRGAYMPSDRLRQADRWGASLKHQHLFHAPAEMGTVGLRLNLNRVSDDNYWRDFPRTSTTLTERLLPSEGVMSWGQGPWSMSAGWHRWQTLQDLSAPIGIPYDRVPSLGVRYNPALADWTGLAGLESSVFTDLTRFESDQPGSIDGQRAVIVGQVSKLWQVPAGFIRPSLQWHARSYQFSQALSDGRTSAQFSVPTLSLDSGLFFERDTQYFGRHFVQTLEPRVLYVRTPYKDQNFLPNYDSAAYDFNLATIFLPNPYAGNDRIADVNALTLGVTSRLLSSESGAEIASLGVAQRVRFSDQRVTLSEATAAERLSDILVGGRLRWNPHWSLDGTVQFNQKTNQSVRTTLGARYNPSNYRVVSMAYRLKRNNPESEQLDLGWQWPLRDLFGDRAPDQGAGRGLGSGQWYSVGRLNYSVPDSKIVDLVAGLEYDGGCWIGRLVVERLQQSLTSANQRILFQLEFTGFSRIGSNPLQTLRDNVPRYQYLREDINPPSRFERYE